MLCISIIMKNKKTSEKCSLPGFLIVRERESFLISHSGSPVPGLKTTALLHFTFCYGTLQDILFKDFGSTFHKNKNSVNLFPKTMV